MEFRVYRIEKSGKSRFLCNTRFVRGLGAQIGLMFHKKLRKGQTLTLELPNAKVGIHTCFVSFPIDLFFLDNKLKIIEKSSLESWRMYVPKKRAKFLLEANKSELRLMAGDKLKVVEGK